ncbi:hypothetical protein [uncultured Jatrophihabitans sp.]|uniref:hypothetical protein n=1 Tax=uncultured Jatrophihabitans sp. TaxID=1610747 RepID=UPI0035CC0137
MYDLPTTRRWDALDAAATIALVVAGALVGITHGAARYSWLAVAVALTSLRVLAASRARAAQRRATRAAEQIAEDIRTSANYAISDAFTPILRLVTELFEAGDEVQREAIRAQIVTSVVYAAAASIGPDHGVRACFFVLDVDTDPDGDGPRRLRWTGQQAGRADEPRSPFVAGTESGDAAIAMVMDDSYLFCRDIESDPPPGWDAHDHVYRTFLSVPVRGVDHATGMLTVDSLRPGDLDPERDKPIVLVLARILAISQISAGA